MNTDTDSLRKSIRSTDEERRRLNAAWGDKERLMWLGRPAPKLCTVQRLLPIPFFTGFALFWASGLWLVTRDVFTGSVTLPMVLFLIPFFPVPFVVLSIVFSGLWEARQLRRSVYALTDRRALVLRKTLFGYKLSHWAANAYGDTLCRKDGSGDIVYETEERRAGRGGVHGFTELPDVESVVALLGTLVPTANEALPRFSSPPARNGTHHAASAAQPLPLAHRAKRGKAVLEQVRKTAQNARNPCLFLAICSFLLVSPFQVWYKKRGKENGHGYQT